ncbi:GGDEF domain-containing protein [Yoonia sp. F2084L]|uniref:GGDEF domain-containing protein n=1 Tax=Yoonia sp. F2084L TaxID=2926419 RepID=UPI001FF16FB7|nr:GGDEF domain-containing protein [Yoonia sp. F2084L]MCK0095720.1 GGDEF domain-containing protein [Yoonia sp. F2084L]
MEKFVRVTAPLNALDFTFKLFVLVGISGLLNHARDMIQNGIFGGGAFLGNLMDASFTAFPMCAFALMLIGHLNFLQKRLYLQATQDALTGLHNRRWFMEKTSERMGQEQAVFIVDVDHFKDINDTFGHDVGDRCLQQIAAHLRSKIRKIDYCARIGGEEFAMVVHDANDDRIRDIAKQISEGFWFDIGDGQTRHVTTSVGVVLGLDGQSRQEALRRADQAVYRAKAQGRAGYVIAPWATQVSNPETTVAMA